MKKLHFKFNLANVGGVCIVVFTWFAYWVMYGNGFNFSKDTAVWGQFGDFLGGVINPLLTFISVVLLINSVNLQREANESLIELDEFKKTEMKFYNMLESQRVNFEHFKIYVRKNGGVETLYNGEATLYIEDLIFDEIDKGTNKEDIKQLIESLDKSEGIFNAVRRFYLLVNLIMIKIPDNKKDEYFETCRGMTDYRLICLLVISLELFDWDNIEDIDKSKILDVKGLKEYREAFKI
nr:MAG TPA_asm: hypothetical protein [Caudoviricetes sp.]